MGFSLNPIHDIAEAAKDVGHAAGDAVGAVEKDVVAPTLSAAAPALNLLSKPLQEVQHYYRAVHDSITRYGWWRGFNMLNPLEAIPAVIGEKFGINLPNAGPFDFGLAEHSWKITSNGTTYRDIHGNAVNPGYDLANVIDNVVHGHDYMPAGWTRDQNGVMQPTQGGGVDLPTGIINAAFDLATDPTVKLGELVKGARAAGIVHGGKTLTLADDAAVRSRQLAHLDSTGQRYVVDASGKKAYVGGRTLVAGRVGKSYIDHDGNIASNIPKLAAANGPVRDLFGTLAGQDTEQILNAYPMLRPIAGDLGKADSIEKVSAVFENAISNRNYSYLDRGLPTTSLTRRLASRAGFDRTGQQAFNDVTGSNKITRGLTTYRPFTIDSKTLRFSGSEFDPDDPASLDGIYRALKMSQSPRSANKILADYIEAPDPGTQRAILANAFRDSLRAIASGRGLSDEEINALPMVQKWTEEVNYELGSAQRRVYGTDEYGNDLHAVDPETNEPLRLGLLLNQQGKMSFPDWNKFRAELSQATLKSENTTAAQKLRGWLGTKDEWLQTHFTQPWKGLTLVSPAFGLRVAAAELIPAFLKFGGAPVLGSSFAAAAEKLNPSLRDLAEEHGDDALKGINVQTKDGLLSKIKSVRRGKATLDIGETHDLDTLDAAHEPVSDTEVLEAAAKHKIPVDPREVGHLRAAIGKALYGLSRPLVDNDYRAQAAYNNLTFGGHMMPDALRSDSIDVRASGGGPAEDARKILHQIGARTKDTQLGENFTFWDNHRSEMPMFWQHNIHEYATKDPGVVRGAQAYLRAIREGATKEEATRAFQVTDREWTLGDSEEAQSLRRNMGIYGQHPEQFSKLRADDLRGLVYAQDGETLNHDILEAIAGERDLPTAIDLANKPHELRPLRVKGRELGPTNIVSGNINRLTNIGFRRLVEPVVNSMSRAPLYTAYSTEEYKALKPLVEAGRLSEDEARSIAQVRGANRMLPQIHNVKLRSQFADLLRNVVPFYFAQEQSYRRYARIVFKDPAAFRRAMLAWHGIHNSGMLKQDGSGNGAVVLPGTSMLGQLVTGGAGALGIGVMGGIPSVMSGNTISLRTVIPEGNAPSVSPLVAVPLREIQNRFPATEPFVSKVVGSVNEGQSITDQLIPNATIRRVLQSTPILDREAAFQSSYLWALAYANHRSMELRDRAAKTSDPAQAKKLLSEADRILPGPTAGPDQIQQALDRIKHSTRTLMMLKAVVGAVSPLAPSMDVGDYKLRAEFQQIIDSNPNGLVGAYQEFLAKHPDATADTVFQSDNTATGTSIPATKAALDWVDKNRGWIDSHHLVSAYLIPQTNQPYDVEAYNQELAIGLRHKLQASGPSGNPKQQGTFLSALYAAATDAGYYKSLDDFEAQRAQLAGNPQAIQQLDSQWAAYKAQLKSANPVWYASHNDGDKVQVAMTALGELRDAVNNPKTPASPQVSIAQELIASYNDYQSQLAAIQNGTAQGSQSALKDAFNTYLDQFVQQTPAASALVTGIFRRIVDA